MKKALSLLALTTLFLTNCSGSANEEAAQEQGKTLYSGEGFEISVPQDWEVLERDDFTANVPAETQVAFRNNEKSEIFTANVNVTKNILNEEVSSIDFAKSSVAKISQSLLSFEKVREEDYAFADGDEAINTLWIEFQGKESATSDLIRFKQLFVVKNKAAYTITGAMLPTEQESIVKQIDEMLNSFTLR